MSIILSTIYKFLIIFNLVAISAFAGIKLSPPKQEMIVSFKDEINFSDFKVENTDLTKGAYSVALYRRTFDKEGKAIDFPLSEGDKMEVYPKKFILNPKESRLIRVIYSKREIPKKELFYILSLKKEDIDFSKKDKIGSKVKIATEFKLKLFIKGKKLKPEISIDSYKMIADKTSKSLFVGFKNSGTSSEIIRAEKLLVKYTRPNSNNILSLSFNKKDFINNDFTYSGRVHPEFIKRFKLPLPKEVKEIISVELLK